MNKIYEVRDPVYGFIEFNEWERDIINHPVFQRLRRIKQLALTDLIYPGAVHTRFEHSLGVMQLATHMFDAIIKKEKNKRLLEDRVGYNKAGFEKDRQLVRLAALLHDVGHTPFSHAAEDLFPKKQDGKLYKHEDYTTEIIINEMSEVIDNHPLNQTNYNITAKEVAALISGDISVLGTRSFWKILISSQLDADRCDYLLRDSLHIGVKYGIYDIDRLLVSVTLGIDPESNEIFLGIDKGGWHVAEALIIARYQMFTQVYYHKTRRSYDFLLMKSLKDSINKFPSPEFIKEFLEYDDYTTWQIMKERDSIWFKRILERNHLRVLFETKEKPFDKEEEYIIRLKNKLAKNNIWFWEDAPQEAKSWYKMNEEIYEIYIIDEDRNTILPLSEFSVIVRSLQKQFKKTRIYVKPEDREKAEKLKKEVDA